MPSFGAAQTGFAGVTGSGLYLTNGDAGMVFGFVGAQVGSYNLFGPLGGRVTAEVSVTPVTGILSGSADLMLASSGDFRVYGGAGLGILSFLDAATPFGKAFAGVDLTVGPNVSLSLEVAPVYSFSTLNAFVGGKVGVNFGFGGF